MCRVTYFCIFLIYIAVTKTDGKYRYDYSFDKEAGGWLKLHETPLTFVEAFLRCNLEGAVLASPLNDNILKAMIKMQAKADVNCGIYTGIHATITKGDFTSIDGQSLEEVGYQPWAAGTPDGNQDKQFCGSMFRNGLFDDVWCDTQPFAFICEKTPDSLITNDEDID